MKTQAALSALRALAQEHRLAIFRVLVTAGSAGQSVGELRETVEIPAATLTAHLNQLRSAGLVLDEREGRVIRVRADYARMDGLLSFLTENCCQGIASCHRTPVAFCNDTTLTRKKPSRKAASKSARKSQ